MIDLLRKLKIVLLSYSYTIIEVIIPADPTVCIMEKEYAPH
jgi:hypothetical protein